MFKYNEVRGWAKAHGMVVKKTGNSYLWGKDSGELAGPCDLDEAVKSVYNAITEGAFKDHQDSYNGTKT